MRNLFIIALAILTAGISSCSQDPDSFHNSVSTLPGVTTDSIKNITNTTAACISTVATAGITVVSQRGVCWSIYPAPTTADHSILNGGGVGTYTTTLTPLYAGTTYYVRAFATNYNGTSYGNELSFTTTGVATVTIPSLTTAPISDTTNSSAKSGGFITSDGGSPVTARGVCWSINSNPTLADRKTSDGTGVGAFVSQLSALGSTTTYHVRAYATNGVGTAYGNEITFTTY